jgi:hypothetical protein
MTDERRKNKRNPWFSKINYQVSNEDLSGDGKVTLDGEVLDISAGGLCLRTDMELLPGFLVSFGETSLAGVVRWSCRTDNSYNAGIQLI